MSDASHLAVSRPRAGRRADPRAATWLALGAITAVAALLRLVDLGAVTLDPFYDAAVRSMGQSWHNFFFGVFEPGGSVSIDKPPVDLWLQVASVKLFGFGSTSLKLPEALAGVASVPILYAAVSRPFGRRAGLAAALALAVLPVEVVTARSDTMDAVMMALVALGLMFAVRACESGATGWLLVAAAVLGLSFDVKLLEALVPLPGLLVMAWLGLPGPRRRRALQLLAAAVVYVVLALSWLTATLLFPAHDRPFAIGSTDGSAWNAAFVFNGYDRIAGKATAGDPITFGRNRHYPTATQSERDHIPITPPSATRLLTRIGPLSGERLGLELLGSLLFGVPALLSVVRRRWAPARPPDSGDPPRARVARAMAVGLLIWLAAGTVLFSGMARLHPRYVEGFTPAVAAGLGIGLAWLTAGERSSRGRVALLGAGLLVLTVYAARLLYGATAVWWVMALGAITATAVAVLCWRRPRGPLSAAALALALVAVLAVPVMASVNVIRERVSDAGHVGAINATDLVRLSAFLRAHQGRARYEVASDSATKVGSLIVRDARPVLILTTYNARTLTSVDALRRLASQGQVSYALVGGACGPHTPRTDASCSAPAIWVRTHARDVSRLAGLSRRGVLWQLPGAIA
jgi:4-amino-4-deoxy-L-arabinose transferase-like glycosyltransferase